MDLNTVTKLVDEINDIPTEGVISISLSVTGKCIHLDIETFKAIFDSYSRVQHSLQYRKIFNKINSVEVFALEEIELDPTVEQIHNFVP